MNKGYKKLRIYHEAHGLVTEVYLVTKKFPKSEIFGLVPQMRRSAVSVVANILEGQARQSKKEFKQFLSIANGSLVEL
jgi:four helix bundle protein